MAKLTLVIGGLIAALVLAGGALAPSAPPEVKAPPWEMAKSKMEAARKTYENLLQEYQEGKATQDQLREWSRHWQAAQRDVSSKKSDQLAAVEGHLERMKQMEAMALTRFQAKRAPGSEVSAAEYYRVDAEMQLSKAKTSR